MRRLHVPVLLSCVVMLLSAQAEARKPEDVFGGKILLSSKPFPTEAKSANQYVSKLKSLSKKEFWEDKEKKQWKIYYAAFFKKPANDLEVLVRFYDISDGTKRVVEAYEQYLEERGQRAIIGNVKLRRGDGAGGYAPNSRIMMTMEVHGKVVAEATFKIGGEGKKFTGKVTFTEEETREADQGEGGSE